MKTVFSLAMAVCVLMVSNSHAQTFSEASLGDFSSNSAAPTSLGQLTAGTNIITGVTGSGDRDLVTFSIGANDTITSLIITEFTDAGGHFLGLDEGTTAGAAATDFLFAGLVTDAETPLQLLGNSGGSVFGSGGTGVPALLASGDYTLFFNETSGAAPVYTAEIVVTTAIPEPGSLAFLSAGLGLIALRRRR